MNEHNLNGKNSETKPQHSWYRRHYRSLIFGAIIMASAYMAYMPVYFYRPFCFPRQLGQPWTYFSPHLSDEYRKHLLRALSDTGTPFLEIGNRLLVPIVPGGKNPEGDKYSPFERIFYVGYYLIFGVDEYVWSSFDVNRKVISSAISFYIDSHPQSEIARLYGEYDEAKWGDNPNKLNRDGINTLHCKIENLITDPNLK